MLRRPASRLSLFEDFNWLWSRALQRGARPLPRPSLVIDPALSKTNRRNPRRYAEADVERRIVFVAPEILFLPRKYRVGLLAHEVGHLICGPTTHTEDEADEAAFYTLRIQVRYDRVNFPAKGLQHGREVYP